MTLTGRVVGPDARPWSAPERRRRQLPHPDLAMAARARHHPGRRSRRASERVPIGGVAWLEAVNCQEVVDRDA
jgi:hypothetical protein